MIVGGLLEGLWHRLTGRGIADIVGQMKRCWLLFLLGLCTRRMDASILVSTLDFLLINLLMVVDQASSIQWSSLWLFFGHVTYHSRAICFQFSFSIFSRSRKVHVRVEVSRSALRESCSIVPFTFTY